jgi:uncharacterized protein (TIGR02271 family)
MVPTRRDVTEGLVVRTADGEKLGRIVRCEQTSFVIEKGIFFPTDYVARYEDIAAVRDGEVYLNRRVAQLRESGVQPTAGVKEQVSVPLMEERLSAEKKTTEAGRVRVRKEVETQRKDISVPVTREQVHVERVPSGGREPRPGEATFQEGEVTVPIREEEIEVRKRPVIREEVRVSKTAREEQRIASGEVRKEKAEIEEEGAIQRSRDEDPDYHT